MWMWDLNELIVRVGYDHDSYVSLAGDSSQADGQKRVSNQPEVLISVFQLFSVSIADYR
jgi:hypothetical protein